ncbi:MAG: pseudouridine synthase, partial [Polyangiaceae bacterium]|nr:pseudouridine synthase [Polyangiaceae bacterium]
MSPPNVEPPPFPLWRSARILVDDRQLLVVNKPPGMPTHGGDESLTHSVVERVGAWLRDQGRDDYLGVHQRLDQDTSGVLLFVTERAMNQVVAEALENKTLKRTYWAVVETSASRKLESRAL